MTKYIKKATATRLEAFPYLKACVVEPNEDWRIDNITTYVRLLDINEPLLFDWSYRDADDFYSWGHNSRYANVFQPLLISHFDKYLNIIMDYVQQHYNKDGDGKAIEEFVDDELKMLIEHKDPDEEEEDM